MKHLHFPTLLMHVGLTILAAVTINHYHDAFLGISLIVLLAHAIWFARSKDRMLPAHILGCIAQFAVYQLGIIHVHSGAFGLGGGEFALFFYELAMAASCILELVIWLIKLKPQK